MNAGNSLSSVRIFLVIRAHHPIQESRAIANDTPARIDHPTGLMLLPIPVDTGTELEVEEGDLEGVGEPPEDVGEPPLDTDSFVIK